MAPALVGFEPSERGRGRGMRHAACGRVLVGALGELKFQWMYTRLNEVLSTRFGPGSDWTCRDMLTPLVSEGGTGLLLDSKWMVRWIATWILDVLQ